MEDAGGTSGDPRSENVVWQPARVGASDRERLLGHRGVVVWLTGLSGSGKSTVATALEARLVGEGRLAYVLDGDNVRHGLCGDLGFSAADRYENIRRIGHVASLFAEAGVIVVTAFISPYRSDRERARRAAGDGRFVEVFLATPLPVCEARDPKGLYRRARRGEVQDFTGISAPYEEPDRPELRIGTHEASLEECVDRIVTYLRENGYLSPSGGTECSATT